MAANFLTLPNELILHIGEMLSDGALNSLILTNTRFAELLNPLLWKFAHTEDDPMFLDLPFPSDGSVKHVVDLLKYAIAVDNVPMGQKILRLCDLEYTLHRDIMDEAIIEAVEHGNHHWVALLLSKVEQQHEQMKTATLDRAARRAVNRADAAIIKRLLRHGTITRHCWDITSRNIIWAENDDLLRVFIEHAQAVPAPTTMHLTGLLVLAIGVKHIPSLDVLRERGAEVDTYTPYDQEPLHEAVFGGDLSVVTWLLDHGADVNAVDRHTRRTAVHTAAQNRDILQLLVDRGADIHRQDGNRLPPLAEAAHAKTPDAFNYLVEADGRMDKSGFSFQAEDIRWCAAAVRDACCPEIITFLLDRIDMAQFGEEILRRSLEGYNVLLLKELHARGVSLGARFPDRGTILHRYAARRVHHYSVEDTPLARMVVEAAEFVLDVRPECIHEVDKRGDTPLHLAAQSGFRLMAQTLLERGASTTALNGRGSTPSDIAWDSSRPVYELIKSYSPDEENEGQDGKEDV